MDLALQKLGLDLQQPVEKMSARELDAAAAIELGFEIRTSGLGLWIYKVLTGRYRWEHPTYPELGRFRDVPPITTEWKFLGLMHLRLWRYGIVKTSSEPDGASVTVYSYRGPVIADEIGDRLLPVYAAALVAAARWSETRKP